MSVLRAFGGLLGLAVLCAGPAAAQTQLEMNASAAADLRRADAALNAQWKITHASMKREDAQEAPGPKFAYAANLLASQRAWLTFRNAQCVIESGEVAGGSLQPMIRAQCLTRLTQERIAQLRELMWTK